MHLSDLLSCSFVIAFISSSMVSIPKEFLAFGLFSWISRTPFSSCTLMVLNVVEKWRMAWTLPGEISCRE